MRLHASTTKMIRKDVKTWVLVNSELSRKKRTSLSPGWKILTFILDKKGIFWMREREDKALTLRHLQDSTKITSGELSM